MCFRITKSTYYKKLFIDTVTFLEARSPFVFIEDNLKRGSKNLKAFNSHKKIDKCPRNTLDQDANH